MKRLIAIWLAAIVILIIGGILMGKIQESKPETTNPKIEYTYIDDEGNITQGTAPEGNITVQIDGEKFSYNSSIWKGQPIKIDSLVFEQKSNIDTFIEAGYTEGYFGVFTKDETHSIYPTYNNSSGRITNIKLYSKEYNENSIMNVNICKDVVLPGNVRLGISTRDYVESIYGTSKEYEFSNENLTTVKYYADSHKRGERLTLYYTKDTGILCAIDWSFDNR